MRINASLDQTHQRRCTQSTQNAQTFHRLEILCDFGYRCVWRKRILDRNFLWQRENRKERITIRRRETITKQEDLLHRKSENIDPSTLWRRLKDLECIMGSDQAAKCSESRRKRETIKRASKSLTRKGEMQKTERFNLERQPSNEKMAATAFDDARRRSQVRSADATPARRHVNRSEIYPNWVMIRTIDGHNVSEPKVVVESREGSPTHSEALEQFAFEKGILRSTRYTLGMT